MTTQEDVVDKIIVAIERQSQNIDTLNETVGVLHQQIEERPTKRKAYGVSIVLNILTLLVVGTVALFAYDASQTNHNVLTTLKGCVDITADDPSCLIESQARTAEAITLIVCNQERHLVVADQALGGQLDFEPSEMCEEFIAETINLDD